MKNITFAIDDQGIARLSLNRPEVHNAFDDALIDALTDAIKVFCNDKQAKILILSANGENFSSGADLNWMARSANLSETENYHDALKLEQLMRTLYLCEKPTIAQVQGRVFGGGIGLVACCQISIASDDAQFCFSEVRLGLAPAVISPYVIQAIGLRQAQARFLTAEVFNAHTAKTLGLCHEVTTTQILAARVEQIAQQLLQHSPVALKAVNHLCHTLYPLAPTTRESTARTIAALRCSAQGQEGIDAFLHKRKPQWPT